MNGFNDTKIDGVSSRTLDRPARVEKFYDKQCYSVNQKLSSNKTIIESLTIDELRLELHTSNRGWERNLN